MARTPDNGRSIAEREPAPTGSGFITPGSSGSRWFWTNTLGTVFADNADIFDAEGVGNAPPGVGSPLQ